MIVDRLKLKNFRSYVDEDVAFAPGVTLFEGDIGSGKSSLLFALEFALFGLADVPGDHLLRAGEKEGLIELEFRAKDKRFTVGRRLVRGKAGGTTQKDAYLIAEGVREEYAVEQLRAAVIKILGFRESNATKAKSQVFRYGIFTPQEEMKAILEQGAEERKQTLRRAFGIEEYKRARENADLVKQALRERAAGLEAVLEGAPRLEGERGEAESKRAAYAAQVEDAQAAREGALAARTRAEEQLGAAERLEARERDLERALAALAADRGKQEERKGAAEGHLKELLALEAEVAPLQAVADGLPDLEAELAAADAREEERRALSETLARAEAGLKALEARKQDIANESELIRKVTDASDAIQEGKRALEAARKALEGVREQAAAVGEAAERVGALKKRLAALEREAGASKEIEGRVKGKEAAAAAGQAAARALESLEDRLKGAQQAQGSCRSAMERAEQELDDLASLRGKAKCPKCKQPLDESHLKGHREELSEALAGARRSLAHAQAQLRTLDKERAGLQRAREEGERAQRERAGLVAELKRSREAAEESKSVEEELEAAQEASTRSDELLRERKRLEREVEAKARFDGEAARLEQATRRWREVSDQYRKVVRALEEAGKTARQTRGLRDALGGGPQEVKRLRELVSTARVKAAKLREAQRRLAGRGELERHRREAEGELAQIARRAAAAREEREALARKLEGAPVAALRKAFEEAASKSAALEERLKGAREGLRLQEEALARALARLEDLGRSRAELDGVRHTRDFIEQCFQLALEEIEVKVLADLNGQLNLRFQAYFGRLMEGAPVDVQIDAEFSPEVMQGPNPLPVQALSGGERTSIALAYRLALNMLVSRAAGMETPDLLILDEPTDGFSKEQLARVGELLRDLDCQQVVLVSHERELESCADQVFEVVKYGTVSRVEAR